MWIEEQADQRVSDLRLVQFEKTGADTLAVSCPFCLQMLGESLGEKGGEVREVLEIVADSLNGP